MNVTYKCLVCEIQCQKCTKTISIKPFSEKNCYLLNFDNIWYELITNMSGNYVVLLKFC